MKSAIAFLLCSLAACSSDGVGSGEGDVIGGVPTNGYPYVVRLGDPNHGICTSTLIAPRVLLTAAHCVGDQVDLKPDLPGNSTIATAKHPTRDLAVAILAKRAGVDTIAPNVSRLTNDRIGDPVQIVGYGLTGHQGEGYNSGKHAAWASLRGFDDNMLHAGTYDVAACQGDSGGPAIMSDPETGEDKVFGILAYTYYTPGPEGQPPIENCIDGGKYERVDTQAAWLKPHLTSCGDRGGTTCEFNGNNACGGVGAYSPDCDMCCGGAITEPRTCGEIGGTKCEIGGNNACGGKGAPTADCDVCCK